MAELVALHGQVLQAVSLLEWSGADLANGAVGVGLTLTSGQLAVYNALDENGLEFGRPDVRWRDHAVMAKRFRRRAHQ